MLGPSPSAAAVLALTLAVLGVGLACPDALAMPKEEGSALLVTEKDDGKTLMAAAGEALTLRLPCQPGAGYTWVILSDPKLVEVEGEPKFETDESRRLGGVTHQVFRLRALAAGTAELELGLVRRWEKERKPKKKFRVTLDIR
jgi:predicted secreted protein